MVSRQRNNTVDAASRLVKLLHGHDLSVQARELLALVIAGLPEDWTPRSTREPIRSGDTVEPRLTGPGARLRALAGTWPMLVTVTYRLGNSNCCDLWNTSRERVTGVRVSDLMWTPAPWLRRMAEQAGVAIIGDVSNARHLYGTPSE